MSGVKGGSRELAGVKQHEGAGWVARPRCEGGVRARRACRARARRARPCPADQAMGAGRGPRARRTGRPAGAKPTSGGVDSARTGSDAVRGRRAGGEGSRAGGGGGRGRREGVARLAVGPGGETGDLACDAVPCDAVP